MSDLIDREALLRQIGIDSDGEPGYYGDTWKFIDTIKKMPSALGTNLAEVGADTISRAKAIEALRNEIVKRRLLDEMYDGCIDEFQTEEILKKLPPAQPAQPERIKGRWIPADTQCGIKCSNCGYPVDDFCYSIDYIDLDYNPNFCPNCGADMRER